MRPIIEVRNLTVLYGRKTEAKCALDCLSLSIGEEEIVGLAGQSGSGKSTLAFAILNLLHFVGGQTKGEIHFEGQDLLSLSEAQLRQIRGFRIALVSQNPASALDPLFTIESQMREHIRAHTQLTHMEERDMIARSLEAAQLSVTDDILGSYPFQLSGGMLQRVCIAMALLHKPSLLIADEPTSSLDVVTQSRVLEVFRNLNRTMSCSILLISHDLAVLGSVCDRIAIMQAGKIVDSGEVPDIFLRPKHNYTRELLNAIPKLPGEK